jgi:hypothetical protein
LPDGRSIFLNPNISPSAPIPIIVFNSIIWQQIASQTRNTFYSMSAFAVKGKIQPVNPAMHQYFPSHNERSNSDLMPLKIYFISSIMD